PSMSQALRSRLLDQLDRPRRPSRKVTLKPSPLLQRRQAWLHRKQMPKRQGPLKRGCSPSGV
ncbi:hypothetical protein, partial [Mesorhizobium sp. M8A.F.Ca.ET.021.01.1.1]|uniref:hypothetical protein n=1 Tax=Mesorhizobium sp. M8A.F.Ca.ET.021.01.1.1 TaxID=2496757 RepID=UPI001AECF18C